MSANEMKKAYVTAVPFGSLTIEGLRDEQGNYYVAATQAATQMQLTAHPNHATRSLQRILGKEFQPTRLKTELNSNPVAAITLKDFEKLIIEAALAGHEGAKTFARTLVGLSLTQLFADAFNDKFNKEERQRYVKQREVHRVNFRPKYTDHLKNDGCKNYAKEVNRLKLSAGVPLEPIETYNDTEVMVLNEKEVEYNLLRKLGYSHNKALRTI